jgi:hypothetical protein
MESVFHRVDAHRRTKEWACAGIFFNMTGAAVSHLVCHDAAWHVVVTLGLDAVAVASWSLRPASRRLVSHAARHSVSAC